tara:strand:- start:3815 stop:4657 length:843 start_codon:yes stop_codon:yes gene_type:complete
MSYKYSTGSVRRGDVFFEDDREGEPTFIDFGQDTITLRPSGSAILYAQADAVGIGTTTPTEILTLNAVDPTIRFEEGGVHKASIGVNSADNILFENKSMNKHIVFKANDQGTVKEGLRLDGAVPEVVVNQRGFNDEGTLVDFRVETNLQTHAFFVDGSANSVGISTGTPHSGLQVDNSVAFAARTVTGAYTITAIDHTIFADTSGGNFTVTLPSAANINGRQYVIKKTDTTLSSVLTIATADSSTIEGASTFNIGERRSIVVQSDNTNWWVVAEFIPAPE